MRDRRHTNLSTSSASSTHSSPALPSRSSMNEKRCSSPPPDGALLPVPVTTKGNWSKPMIRRITVLRVLAAVCALLVCTRGLLSWPTTRWDARVRVDSVDDSPAAMTAGRIELPSEPTVVRIPGSNTHQHWMVSIPADSPFPLSGSQYHDICTAADRVDRDNPALTWPLGKIGGWSNRDVYGRPDNSYIDVQEAHDSRMFSTGSQTDKNVCKKSLTFVLDADDTSFGKALLLLWLSYGFAKEEDRAFFIDDTRWAYGKYTTYFMPPPLPACAPAPPSQIVPCPHGARHIVVSTATAPWTFGPAFRTQYTRTRKSGLERSHAVFNMLRTGYENLFHPFGEDAAFIHQRTLELKTTNHPTIGLHIRRGDLHPFSYEYNRDYLPLETYTTAAADLSRMLSPNPTRNTTTNSLLLASDDPSLISNPDLTSSTPTQNFQLAQSRIQLATKAALDSSSPAPPLRSPGSAYTKHVPENAGWDGGFYPSLFAHHGNARVRELVGRGYLLDMAVLGQSEGVVCAVSSASCRVLGVMLGWEGVQRARWRNVDDGREWSWDGSRW